MNQDIERAQDFSDNAPLPSGVESTFRGPTFGGLPLDQFRQKMAKIDENEQKLAKIEQNQSKMIDLLTHLNCDQVEDRNQLKHIKHIVDSFNDRLIQQTERLHLAESRAEKISELDNALKHIEQKYEGLLIQLEDRVRELEADTEYAKDQKGLSRIAQLERQNDAQIVVNVLHSNKLEALEKRYADLANYYPKGTEFKSLDRRFDLIAKSDWEFRQSVDQRFPALESWVSEKISALVEDIFTNNIHVLNQRLEKIEAHVEDKLPIDERVNVRGLDKRVEHIERILVEAQQRKVAERISNIEVKIGSHSMLLNKLVPQIGSVHTEMKVDRQELNHLIEWKEEVLAEEKALETDPNSNANYLHQQVRELWNQVNKFRQGDGELSRIERLETQLYRIAANADYPADRPTFYTAQQAHNVLLAKQVLAEPLPHLFTPVEVEKEFQAVRDEMGRRFADAWQEIIQHRSDIDTHHHRFNEIVTNNVRLEEYIERFETYDESMENRYQEIKKLEKAFAEWEPSFAKRFWDAVKADEKSNQKVEAEQEELAKAHNILYERVNRIDIAAINDRQLLHNWLDAQVNDRQLFREWFDAQGKRINKLEESETSIILLHSDWHEALNDSVQTHLKAIENTLALFAEKIHSKEWFNADSIQAQLNQLANSLDFIDKRIKQSGLPPILWECPICKEKADPLKWHDCPDSNVLTMHYGKIKQPKCDPEQSAKALEKWADWAASGEPLDRLQRMEPINVREPGQPKLPVTEPKHKNWCRPSLAGTTDHAEWCETGGYTAKRRVINGLTPYPTTTLELLLGDLDRQCAPASNGEHQHHVPLAKTVDAVRHFIQRSFDPSMRISVDFDSGNITLYVPIQGAQILFNSETATVRGIDAL